jgi:hypothetical protein
MITLLGWIGAGLALVAYAQTGAARFRQIALLSSAALLTFNVLLGIWSNVALECALGAVNVRRLLQLRASALEPERRWRHGRRFVEGHPVASLS